MRYISIGKLLKTTRSEIQQKGENTPLHNSGRLSAGWYTVTIAAVDLAKLELGRILFCFESTSGSHWESVFLADRAESDLGYGFKMLLNGLFNYRTDEMLKYLDLLESDEQEEAFHMLRGIKLDIEIKPGPGYVLEGVHGKCQATDSKTGAVLATHTNMRDLKKQVEAMGHTESRNRICNVQPLDLDITLEAIQNAREAVLDSENAIDSTTTQVGGSGQAATE